MSDSDGSSRSWSISVDSDLQEQHESYVQSPSSQHDTGIRIRAYRMLMRMRTRRYKSWPTEDLAGVVYWDAMLARRRATPGGFRKGSGRTDRKWMQQAESCFGEHMLVQKGVIEGRVMA